MKTNRDIQAAYKERMRSAGFILLALWVHREDKERVKKYVERLRKRRYFQAAGQ
jgi:hypothetical protein